MEKTPRKKKPASKRASPGTKQQRIPKPLLSSPSGNGLRAKPRKAGKKDAGRKSRAASTRRPISVIDLLRLPKGDYRDIGELSFAKRSTRSAAVAAAAAAVDARVRVADTRLSPFRKVCDLLITARDGTLHTGTAWFISPRTLVTAGHCLSVFRPGTPVHGLVNSIILMPARNGENSAGSSAFGWLQVTQPSFQVHPGWANNGILDLDFGAIILPTNTPLGATVGFFGFGHFEDQQLDENLATISGYPDDVPEGTQWFETNRIKEVNPTRVFYDIFTATGQSGSPVFFGNATQQVACAIHNFGATPLNSGVRINPQVVAQLNAWRF